MLYANVASFYTREESHDDWQFAFAASRREKREQKYADEILEEKIQCREVLLSQIIDPKLDTRYSIFSRAMELSRLVVKITSKESKPHIRGYVNICAYDEDLSKVLADGTKEGIREE